MQILIDELEYLYYADIILTLEDMKELNEGKSLMGNVTYKRRKCNVVIRTESKWDKNLHEQEKDEERE